MGPHPTTPVNPPHDSIVPFTPIRNPPTLLQVLVGVSDSPIRTHTGMPRPTQTLVSRTSLPIPSEKVLSPGRIQKPSTPMHISVGVSPIPFRSPVHFLDTLPPNILALLSQETETQASPNSEVLSVTELESETENTPSRSSSRALTPGIVPETHGSWIAMSCQYVCSLHQLTSSRTFAFNVYRQIMM